MVVRFVWDAFLSDGMIRDGSFIQSWKVARFRSRAQVYVRLTTWGDVLISLIPLQNEHTLLVPKKIPLDFVKEQFGFECPNKLLLDKIDDIKLCLDSFVSCVNKNLLFLVSRAPKEVTLFEFCWFPFEFIVSVRQVAFSFQLENATYQMLLKPITKKHRDSR